MNKLQKIIAAVVVALFPLLLPVTCKALNAEESDILSTTLGETAEQVPKLKAAGNFKARDMKKLLPGHNERISQEAVLRAQEALKSSEQKVRQSKNKLNQNPATRKALEQAKANARKKLSNYKRLQSNHTKVKNTIQKARINAAKTININKKKIIKYPGAAKTFGGMLQVADSGSTILGHVVEGDYSGATGAGANEGAKLLASTAGASSGAWSGAAAGTFIGGPPGALVGGVIGAISGAVAGTATYNYLIGNKIKAIVEKFSSAPEIAPLEKAKLARKAFLDDKKFYLEKARQARKEYLREKKHYLDKARRARKEHLQKEAAAQALLKNANTKTTKSSEKKRRKDGKIQQEALAKKAKRKAATGIAIAKTYDSIPVIEQSCTIDAVFWTTDRPDHRTSVTLYIQGGHVTSTFQVDSPGNSFKGGGCSDTIIRFKGTGILHDNIIEMQTIGQYAEPRHCYHRFVSETKSFNCHRSSNIKITINGVITLNIDGTLTEPITVHSTLSQKIWGDNCSWTPEKQEDKPTSLQGVGIWHKRE